MVRCAWCRAETPDFGVQDGWACCSASCAWLVTICRPRGVDKAELDRRVAAQTERMVRGEPWWRTPDEERDEESYEPGPL